MRLRGTLAFLSACNTSATTPWLADEAIHITSAFQLAGFPQVIGTLWAVNDTAAQRIATDVYGTNSSPCRPRGPRTPTPGSDRH